MIWVLVIALVLVIGAIAVVVAGRDDAMAEVYDDRPDATLPTGRPLTAEDIAAVRLSTAVRGYRMDEVDALLARIQADLMTRETTDIAAAADETPAETPDETPAETSAETSAGPPRGTAAERRPGTVADRQAGTAAERPPGTAAGRHAVSAAEANGEGSAAMRPAATPSVTKPPA